MIVTNRRASESALNTVIISGNFMNYIASFLRVLPVIGIVTLTARGAAAETANPYKIVNTAQTLGTGGLDYVYADNDGRRLYIPRGNQVLVFDLDTLKSVGSITNARARGAAVDPKSHHGF